MYMYVYVNRGFLKLGTTEKGFWSVKGFASGPLPGPVLGHIVVSGASAITRPASQNTYWEAMIHAYTSYIACICTYINMYICTCIHIYIYVTYTKLYVKIYVYQ